MTRTIASPPQPTKEEAEEEVEEEAEDRILLQEESLRGEEVNTESCLSHRFRIGN